MPNLSYWNTLVHNMYITQNAHSIYTANAYRAYSYKPYFKHKYSQSQKKMVLKNGLTNENENK